MASQTSQPSEDAPTAERRPNRVAVGSAAYNEVAEYLYEEALALDELRLHDWADGLAEDLVYTAPMRQTRHRTDQHRSIVRSVKHFDETFASIQSRIGRLNTNTAWAEDPPSRTRRLVTNILVDATSDPDEFDATSYVLLTRSRFEETELVVMSMVRHDRLRRIGERMKLARREIILDQSVLGMPNLAVFL